MLVLLNLVMVASATAQLSNLRCTFYNVDGGGVGYEIKWGFESSDSRGTTCSGTIMYMLF